MEIEFNNQVLKFYKEGDNNLITDTRISNYNQIEIDININQFTKIIDDVMISNILAYVDSNIHELENKFKPLLGELFLKTDFSLDDTIKLEDVKFKFVGIWIKSMNIFNSQFELVYYLDGQQNISYLDVTGKWTLNFSGSINNWVLSGVNRIG